MCKGTSNMVGEGGYEFLPLRLALEKVSQLRARLSNRLAGGVSTGITFR